MASLIAFTGYARVGKDTAAMSLIRRGFCRVALGDIIKGQVDELVRKHLGFSAFTEKDEEKQLIRGLLEQWGEANYDGVMQQLFMSLPRRVVNTRLVRAREGSEWCRRGGVIIHVARPGVGPATRWEEDCLEELYDAGLIGAIVINRGSLEELHEQVDEAAVKLGVDVGG